jgi:hypothetical protein
LDGIGEGVTAFKHFISGIVAKEELLGGEVELESFGEEGSELFEMSVHGGSCYRVKKMDIIFNYDMMRVGLKNEFMVRFVVNVISRIVFILIG